MRLRTVSAADLGFIYKLYTHPDILSTCHNKRKYTIGEHCVWWMNRGFNNARIILYKDNPVGLIRKDDDSISIAILPEYQDKGFGTKSIKKFTKNGDTAQVLWSNLKSLHVFRKAGFKEQYITLKR